MSITETLKKNKLLKIILLLVAIYIGIKIINIFLGVNILSSLRTSPRLTGSTGSSQATNLRPGQGITNPSLGGLSAPSLGRSQDYAPQTEVEERLVVQNSTLSLLIKDVVDARDKVVSFAQQAGGYMVNVQTSNPQDAPTATVVVRIPSDKLEEALQFYRSLSVKVVSENLVGKDVTDEYVDIDTRISQIESTKERLDAILDTATQISEITNLTTQISNYQNQIDSLKGRQQALEQNAKLAKITIYLSTDEIALPYAPSETFRPGVIFKLAVRSLVGTLRKLATLVIWVGVYSVVWVPALGIYIYIRKRKKMIKQPEKPIPNSSL